MGVSERAAGPGPPPRLVMDDGGSRWNASLLSSSPRFSSIIASRLRARVPGENGSCTEEAAEGLGIELLSPLKLSSPLGLDLRLMVELFMTGHARLVEDKDDEWCPVVGSLRMMTHTELGKACG